MLGFYRFLTQNGKFALNMLLKRRLQRSKEDPARIDEKRGIYTKPRPNGALFWVHAASVGEAQSALILINRLLGRHKDLQILITSGTRTSAQMMADKLPERAFHQYYPLDHPDWVVGFLDHWNPDAIFWMESELWPNMLLEIQDRKIPAMLVNARLSKTSFRRWMMFKGPAQKILGAFSRVLTQTDTDAQRFHALGIDTEKIVVTDNLKYSARPLAYDEKELKKLLAKISQRPVWLYASSHDGEEQIACRVHQQLKIQFPDLLTIIAPRHPERRDSIQKSCANFELRVNMRGKDKTPPDETTDIYIADTMGELGLLYRLVPVACIGRSFSLDGGGGHNPIEAAQLHCAILHGPHVHYQQEIFDEMHIAGVALNMRDESMLANTLQTLLSSPEKLQNLQKKGYDFAQEKDTVIEKVMKHILPLTQKVAA